MPLPTVTNGQVSDASQINGPINLLNLMRAEQTVTEAVLVSGVDASVAENVYCTLTANRVVGAPLNPVAGQRLHFVFTQNGTGGWTLTWNAAFNLTNWTLNTAANAKTEANFSYIGSTWVLASNPPSLKSQFVIINAVTDYAADNTGTNDAGPAIRSALAALPSSGSVGAGGQVYLPPGTYLISSADGNNNGLTLTASNTRLIGAGRDATTIKITKDNLTWGIALTTAQQVLEDCTVNFNGSVAPFWMVGMPGVPGRSAQSCRFNRITSSINSGTIPVPPAGPPNDGVHSSIGAGIFAIGPDYPGTATFDAGNTHFDECLANRSVSAAQVVTGYIIGNGTSGNVVAIMADDCQVNNCTYGIQLCGGGIRWVAGGFGANTDTDIVLQHGGGDPLLFVGARLENGNRALWSGNIGDTSPLVLVGCEVGNYTPTNTHISDGGVVGQILKWNARGTLIITGGHMQTTLGNTTFGLCTDGGAQVSLITDGLWTDVNPYPAANLARFHRFIRNATTGADPTILAGFEWVSDGLLGSYNGIVTAGLGIPAIYKAPTLLTGQTAAVASITTITSPNDGAKHKYRISGTVRITTLGSGNVNLETTYTDSNGTAQTCILPLCAQAGTFATSATTADDYKGHVIVTVNPNTAITILTAGTFTGCTYSVDGLIEQLS